MLELLRCFHAASDRAPEKDKMFNDLMMHHVLVVIVYTSERNNSGILNYLLFSKFNSFMSH